MLVHLIILCFVNHITFMNALLNLILLISVHLKNILLTVYFMPILQCAGTPANFISILSPIPEAINENIELY